jgi:predicted PurR-regulated permease PerM
LQILPQNEKQARTSQRQNATFTQTGTMSAWNRNLLWLLGTALLLAVFYYLSDIVTYILLAWVFSMLGRPLMAFFMRRLRIGRFRMGASGAALLTILVFYAVFLGILLAFVPTIVTQARNLSGVDYQALGEKLRVPFANLDLQLHQLGLLTPGESLATRTQELLSQWFKPALLGDFLGQFVAVAGNIVVTATAVTFILFFFLKDNRLFLDILQTLVPNEQEPKVRHAVQESSEVLTSYFGGLVAQVAAFSLMVTLFLWIMGGSNALLIGAFGGIFNVIPYIGPIMGAVFGMFITISSNLDLEFALLWPLLLKVAAAFVLTQFVDNNFLGPLIMSKSVQAHPLEIFIVTLIAAKIGGVLGMVIGIPVYTVLRVIARVFFSEFKVVQRLTEHLDEE